MNVSGLTADHPEARTVKTAAFPTGPALIFALLALLAGSDALAFHISDLSWSFDGDLRFSYFSTANSYDLDSGDQQDEGISSLGHLFIDGALRINPRLFLYSRLEWRGPADYDLLLGGDCIRTLAGQVERVEGDTAIPELSRLWLQATLIPNRLFVDAGLFPANFTQSLGLNNKHENFGILLSSTWRSYWAHLQWEIPGLNSRLRLGKERQEDEVTNLEHVKANYLALAVSRTNSWLTGTVYASILEDKTPADRRFTAFDEEVDRDRLGTYGLKVVVSRFRFRLASEFAQNFGGAEYLGHNVFKHTGQLYSFEAQAFFGFFNPFITHLTATGNRMTPEDFKPGLLPTGDYRKFKYDENHAFSSYSPSGLDLFATRYPLFVGPMLATGSSYDPIYGIRRPGIFGDPHLPSDLILDGFGMRINLDVTLDCSLTWWILETEQPALGIVAGEIEELSRELGQELDVSLNYRPTLLQGLELTVNAACFLPGQYYKTTREDPDYYLVAPILNNSAKTDSATLYECAVSYRW